jgi:hypothetical protein
MTNSQAIDLNEYFFNRMRVAMERVGYEIEEFGAQEASRYEQIPPQGLITSTGAVSAINSVGNRLGQLTREIDPIVPVGQIKITSAVHVAVAKKPEK